MWNLSTSINYKEIMQIWCSLLFQWCIMCASFPDLSTALTIRIYSPFAKWVPIHLLLHETFSTSMGDSTVHTDVTVSSVSHDNVKFPVEWDGGCPIHLRSGDVTSSVVDWLNSNILHVVSFCIYIRFKQ